MKARDRIVGANVLFFTINNYLVSTSRTTPFYGIGNTSALEGSGLSRVKHADEVAVF